MPTVGSEARIRHFGGGVEGATIVALREEGRRLQVRADSGELLEFVLNGATARFLEAGPAQGARLEILASSDAAGPRRGS
jgi:predicted thioesterase